MYVNDISSGITLKEGEPILIKENVATAYVNGSNLLGPVVGNFCMSIAIQKAKEAGIGWVAAKGMLFLFLNEKININSHILSHSR